MAKKAKSAPKASATGAKGKAKAGSKSEKSQKKPGKVEPTSKTAKKTASQPMARSVAKDSVKPSGASKSASKPVLKSVAKSGAKSAEKSSPAKESKAKTEQVKKASVALTTGTSVGANSSKGAAAKKSDVSAGSVSSAKTKAPTPSAKEATASKTLKSSATKPSVTKQPKAIKMDDLEPESFDEAGGLFDDDAALAADLEVVEAEDLEDGSELGDEEAPAPQAAGKRGRTGVAKSQEADEDTAVKSTEKKTKRRDELKIDRGGNIEAQWKLLFEKSKSLKPVPYKMSESYEAKTALIHKVLGWGYVLTSQNNRLEVLFKDGIKILIANYKA